MAAAMRAEVKTDVLKIVRCFLAMGITSDRQTNSFVEITQ
jgi:hypothetical protein